MKTQKRNGKLTLGTTLDDLLKACVPCSKCKEECGNNRDVGIVCWGRPGKSKACYKCKLPCSHEDVINMRLAIKLGLLKVPANA